MSDGGNFLPELDLGIVQSLRDSHVCLITVQRIITHCFVVTGGSYACRIM